MDATVFPVNDSAAGLQSTPRIAFRGNLLVITWEDSPPVGYLTVQAQAYTWDNTLRSLGGNFIVPNNTAATQFFQAVAIDSTGTDFIVAWQGSDSSDPDGGAYFKRFTALDATPQGFALQALPPQTSSLLTIPSTPQAGALLGLFTDPSPGSWTYSLVAGPGSTDNASFQITNGFLSMTQAGVTGGIKAQYSILVLATPAIGVPVEQVFNFAAAVSGPVNFGQLSPTISQAYGVAFQGNGDFVLVGESFTNGLAGNTAIARYLPDGTLDPSFGGTGTVVTPLLDGFNFGNKVVVQPNGQIVVVGAGNPGNQFPTDAVFVARYNSDGTLDGSFGNKGVAVNTSFYSTDPAVLLQDDGGIVIAAANTLARYLPNGTLDPAFGTGGMVTLSLGGTNEHARALVLQPDGKIVVAGYQFLSGEAEPFVARFLTNGSLDVSFNGVGSVSLPTLTGNQFGNAVAVQPDGKIVFGGSFGIWRFNANGTTDTTWGGTGLVATGSLSSPVVPILSVTVEPDGKVLAAGQVNNGTNHDFVFLNYNATGGINNLTTKDFGGDDYADGLALASNAQVVVAGYTGPKNGAVDNFAIWQLDLNNVPTSNVQGTSGGIAGQPLSVTLGALSPSLINEAGGFTYQVDWGDHTGLQVFQGLNGLSVTHVYTAPAHIASAWSRPIRMAGRATRLRRP